MFSLECVPNNLCFYFSNKIYVVGTQKNRLNESKLMGKKIFTITRDSGYQKNNFLIFYQTICCGYSKEPSQ